MTVTEMIKALKRLRKEGYGDYTVMINSKLLDDEEQEIDEFFVEDFNKKNGYEILTAI